MSDLPGTHTTHHEVCNIVLQGEHGISNLQKVSRAQHELRLSISSYTSKM